MIVFPDTIEALAVVGAGTLAVATLATAHDLVRALRRRSPRSLPAPTGERVRLLSPHDAAELVRDLKYVRGRESVYLESLAMAGAHVSHAQTLTNDPEVQAQLKAARDHLLGNNGDYMHRAADEAMERAVVERAL